MRSLLPNGLLCLLICTLGCDSADDGNDDEAETGGAVTNACGTFDPNEPGDSVIPQDPDDPEILSSCMALCEVQAEIEGCTTEAAACVDHCKMRSCDSCPTTLAPLVDCETVMFTGEGCTCAADGIDCPVPAGCSDLEQKITECGG
jgi:hypothetical protein